MQYFNIPYMFTALPRKIYSMLTIGELSIDGIKTDAPYDLTDQYEAFCDMKDSDVDNSPFINNLNQCEYYEPAELNKTHLDESMIIIQNYSRSYFDLNCHGLSSNWEQFHDLMCDFHLDGLAFDFIGISEVF